MKLYIYSNFTKRLKVKYLNHTFVDVWLLCIMRMEYVTFFEFPFFCGQGQCTQIAMFCCLIIWGQGAITFVEVMYYQARFKVDYVHVMKFIWSIIFGMLQVCLSILSPVVGKMFPRKMISILPMIGFSHVIFLSKRSYCAYPCQIRRWLEMMDQGKQT